MIAVPKYLREIAEVKDSKAENLTVKISCPCGCRRFLILKNMPEKIKISKEDQRKIQATKKWWKDFQAKFFGCAIYSSLIDGRNNIWVFKYEDILTSASLRCDTRVDLHGYKNLKTIGEQMEYLGFKPVEHIVFNADEVPLPDSVVDQLKPQDDNTIFKAICADCGNEYLLFDSRIHGNDAAEDKPQILEEYKFKLKKIGGLDTPVEIIISLINFWDFEDIASNCNEGLTADDYSEMFGEIKIKAVTTDGKTVMVYSEDLG